MIDLDDPIADYMLEMERMRELREANKAPAPALPYEVFQTEPADPQRAWAAVVLMCRGQ